jgi:hypothetical protein
MNTQRQKNVSLSPSGEEETGNAGEQLVRNNLTDWNGHGGLTSPLFHMIIPRNYVLKKPNEKHVETFFYFL